MNAPIRVEQYCVTLDCPDAEALGEFYARLLGWRTEFSPDDPGWVDVTPPAGEPAVFAIACQQIDGYRPPTWPEGSIPQQAHLDLYVESISAAEPVVLACGAMRHEHQPSYDESFAIYLDPAGHPFCLCEKTD